MPDWLVPFLVGSGTGGVAGYVLHAWIDDLFSERREKRKSRRDDLQMQRDALLHFLGRPRAHFTWLENVHLSQLGTGSPPLPEKIEQITGWIYANRPRFPEAVQRSLNVINAVTYQLAVGDREFVNTPAAQMQLKPLGNRYKRTQR